MRFSVLVLLLATSFTNSSAKPLPSDVSSVERSWTEDQSEVQLHTARQASWPIIRTTEAEDTDLFEFTTDERTMQEHSRMRVKHQKRGDAGLIARVKAFVADFMAHRGDEGMIGARAIELGDLEAPVLQPRKGMRYRYAAR